MPYSFWEAVAETPWWIYWMFFCFFYFAYLTTKPRIVFLKSALVAESIFVVLLFLFLGTIAEFNLFNVFLFISAFIAGALIGWIQFWYNGIKVIKNTLQFYAPGSWSVFILIFVILFIKYYFFGPRFIFDPSILSQSDVHRYIVALVGLLVGLFVGRASYGFKCIKYGPYIEKKDLPKA